MPTRRCGKSIVKVARVFPRKIALSPRDAGAHYGVPGIFDEADEVHVSCLFTWDMRHAEWLAEQWRHVAPVQFGGPGDPQNKAGMLPFVPGMYVRDGVVVTSRGCPNRCWFCSVWKREHKLCELPVTEGWNIIDDNLLACGEEHIQRVFAMLKRQENRAAFTGGLEAARLRDWHVELLADLGPDRMFFAYDTPDDREPLYVASKMLREGGFTRHHMRCYCLIGGPGDTIEEAENRLRWIYRIGYDPMAMLWCDEEGKHTVEWKRFARMWAWPALYRGIVKKKKGGTDEDCE